MLAAGGAVAVELVDRQYSYLIDVVVAAAVAADADGAFLLHLSHYDIVVSDESTEIAAGSVDA